MFVFLVFWNLEASETCMFGIEKIFWYITDLIRIFVEEVEFAKSFFLF